MAAGLGAKRVFAFSEAKRHFERALELWDRVPDAAERAGCDRVDVLKHAAFAAHHAGEVSRSIALIRKAIAEVDADAEPVRAALLYERLGLYPRARRGRDRGGPGGVRAGAGAASRRRERGAGAGAGPPRARAGAARAQSAAAAKAAEALAMAERLGDRDTEGRALNTLGISVAKLGDIDEGVELLRRSRDLFTDGPPAERVQAHTNLSDILDNAGRTEEALEEVRAGMAAVRAQPERTHYDTFLELQGVNLLIRLGPAVGARGRAADGAVRRRRRHDADPAASAARDRRDAHRRPGARAERSWPTCGGCASARATRSSSGRCTG